VREAGGGIELESTEKGEKVRCLAVVVATERLPCDRLPFRQRREDRYRDRRGRLSPDQRSNIYAAGDCAELFDKETRTARINFGWRSAIKQGRLAGENMAGGGKRYVPGESDYFWALFGPALLDRIR